MINFNGQKVCNITDKRLREEQAMQGWEDMRTTSMLASSKERRGAHGSKEEGYKIPADDGRKREGIAGQKIKTTSAKAVSISQPCASRVEVATVSGGECDQTESIAWALNHRSDSQSDWKTR